MTEHAKPDAIPDTTDLFEIMRTTRSMRRLKPDPVPNELIRKILDAGSARRAAETCNDGGSWSYEIRSSSRLSGHITSGHGMSRLRLGIGLVKPPLPYVESDFSGCSDQPLFRMETPVGGGRGFDNGQSGDLEERDRPAELNNTGSGRFQIHLPESGTHLVRLPPEISLKTGDEYYKL